MYSMMPTINWYVQKVKPGRKFIMMILIVLVTQPEWWGYIQFWLSPASRRKVEVSDREDWRDGIKSRSRGVKTVASKRGRKR